MCDSVLKEAIDVDMASEHDDDPNRATDRISDRADESERGDGVKESVDILNERLDTIESHTRQTNLDLEELCRRLKNNYHYLNQLLENLSHYSNEVVTEGNATKEDISQLSLRLEDVRLQVNAVKSTDVEDLVHKIRQILEEKVDTSHSQTNVNLNKILNELCKKLPAIEASIGLTKEAFFEEIKHLKDTANNQEQIMKSLIDAKRSTSTSSRLSADDDSSSWLSSSTEEKGQNLVKKIDEMKEETKTQNNDILLELASASLQRNDVSNLQKSLVRIDESLVKKDNQILTLTKLAENQAAVIEKFISSPQETAPEKNLEKKTSELDRRYESLCATYQKKYNDFKALQNRYQELFLNVQEAPNRVSLGAEGWEHEIQHMQKVRQFHDLKMNDIKENEYQRRLPGSFKRFFSNPLGYTDKENKEDLY